MKFPAVLLGLLLPGCALFSKSPVPDAVIAGTKSLQRRDLQADSAVFLSYFSGDNAINFCNGTLVGDGVVLTAAHCLRRENSGFRVSALPYWQVEPHAAGPNELEGQRWQNVRRVERFPDARVDAALLFLDSGPPPYAFMKAAAFFDTNDHIAPTDHARVTTYFSPIAFLEQGLFMTSLTVGAPRERDGELRVDNPNTDALTFGNSGTGIFVQRGGVPLLAGVLVRGSPNADIWLAVPVAPLAAWIRGPHPR